MYAIIRKTISAIPRLSPQAAAGLLLLLGTGLFAIYERERLANGNYMYQVQLETVQKIAELRENIQTEVFDRILELQILSTVLRTSPDVPDQVFDGLVQRYLVENPDVIHISVAPDLIISRVYPPEGNQGLLARDYRKDQSTLPKLMRALQDDHGIVLGPVALDHGWRGLVLHQPVLLQGQGADPAAVIPWGIISIAVDYESFLTRLNLSEISSSYDVLIREIGDETSAQQVFSGNPELITQNPETLMFKFPFGVWEIAATPAGGWPANRPGFLTSVLIEFSVLTAALALIWYVIGLSDAYNANKRLLTNAIEALPDGFATFDPNGMLQTYNSKFETLFSSDASCVRPGISYERLVFDAIQKGIFPDAEGLEDEWFAEWQKKRALSEYDTVVRSADGRIFRVSDRRMPDQSTVGLRIDITELENAKTAAEATNQAKSDFMAVLSHELRTPLTVMLGMTRLHKDLSRLPAGRALIAAMDELSAGDRERIESKANAVFDAVSDVMGKLENSGDHIMFLVNEILDFAKLEASGLSLAPQEVDIGEIMQKAADQISPLITDKGLMFDVTPISQVMVLDPVRIQQVLMNLLGNAAKFTASGGISLSATALPQGIEILVTDTGLGMPADEVDKVFEPFHQVDPQNRRGFGGTGLGLAISREIAEAHGGTLTATSVEGQGSTFRLFLKTPTGLEVA